MHGMNIKLKHGINFKTFFIALFNKSKILFGKKQGRSK
jgi:hypothetical protein